MSFDFLIDAVTATAVAGVSFAWVLNGVGIPAENLERIFRHGFSTRNMGHGFDLHGSAKAATEMGGSLSVHSSGSSHGATFSLRIPLNSAVSQPP